MKENPNIAVLGEVLLKYRFVEPAPVEVQRHIRKIKRKQFQVIMKRTAGYTLLFSLISNIFLALKKYGIGITIVKSAVLLGIITLMTAGAVTTGVYFFMVRDVPDNKTIGVMDVIREAAPAVLSDGAKEPPAVIEDRLGVQPFAGIQYPAVQAARASDRIAKSLAALRGDDRVVNLRFGREGKKSGMMLFGSVELSGGTYIVTARVASVKDSRILFYDMETAGTDAEVEGACDRLARKIYEKIR